MKPLLFGIAALLIGLPAQSETIYLVLRYALSSSTGRAASMVYIPMESTEQCNIAGAKMKSSKRFTSSGDNIGFECIEGK